MSCPSSSASSSAPLGIGGGGGTSASTPPSSPSPSSIGGRGFRGVAVVRMQILVIFVLYVVCGDLGMFLFGHIQNCIHISFLPLFLFFRSIQSDLLYLCQLSHDVNFLFRCFCIALKTDKLRKVLGKPFQKGTSTSLSLF